MSRDSWHWLVSAVSALAACTLGSPLSDRAGTAPTAPAAASASSAAPAPRTASESPWSSDSGTPPSGTEMSHATGVDSGASGARSVVASADAGSSPEQATDYAVARYRLRLIVGPDGCSLAYRSASSRARSTDLAEQLKPLNLTAPCAWVLWTHEPGPRSGAVGSPVGAQGMPAAWRYSRGNGVVVIAVIGTPPTDEQWQKHPRQRSGICMSRIRGVLIRDGRLSLSKRVVDQFVCKGWPLDEITYGLLSDEG